MQNYASSTLAKIDERMYSRAKTAPIVNKGITLNFHGLASVTIYQVDVVPENNYVRSGVYRFGTIVEIGTGIQEFTLSQDKSFAISVDQGNRDDSQMVTDINKAVKRQVREVSTPATDIYTLAVACAYAVANSQKPGDATLSKSTVFDAILTERAALIDADFPLDNIYVYVNPTIERFLWLDPEFKGQCDVSARDKKTGVMGTIMGMTLVVVKTSYFPSKINFLMIADNVLIRPMKFNYIETGKGFPFGIHGMVAQGRRYYDVFIPANKGAGIRVHRAP